MDSLTQAALGATVSVVAFRGQAPVWNILESEPKPMWSQVKRGTELLSASQDLRARNPSHARAVQRLEDAESNVPQSAYTMTDDATKPNP